MPYLSRILIAFFSANLAIMAVDVANEVRPRFDSRAGNSVDTATGAFIQEINLVRLQGAREISVDLYYNSRLGFRRGDVGLGWTHQYESKAVRIGEQIRVNHNNLLHSLFKDGEGFDGNHIFVSDDHQLNNLDRLVSVSSGTCLIRESGVRNFFDPMGRLLKIENGKLQPIFTEYYSDGRLASVQEPVSGRKIWFSYRHNIPARFSFPLLSYISYSGDSEVYRFLQYDVEDRLTRIYDPVQMPLVGENGSSLPVPLGPSGVEYGAEVDSSFSDRLIRVNGNISGGAPETLNVTLLSPTGKELPLERVRIGLNGENLFTVSGIFDDFLGDPLAGEWKLRVIDNTDDGQNHTVNSLRIQVADEAANWTGYEYDESLPQSGRIVKSVDSLGETIWENAYEPELGRVSFQYDGRTPAGVWKFNYVPLASDGLRTRVSPRTSRDGSVFATYEHDAHFNLSLYEDELGNKTEYRYLSNFVKGRERWGFGSNGPDSGFRDLITSPIIEKSTTFFYNSFDLRISGQRLGRNNVEDTVFNHDIAITLDDGESLELGGARLTTVRDELKRESVFEYDGSNNLIKVVNPLQNALAWEYGEEDGLLSKATSKEPLNAPLNTEKNKTPTIVEIDYTSGLPTSAKTSETQEEKFDYDGLGRVVRAIDAENNATVFKYDNRGNVIEKINASGHSFKSIYDQRNRLKEQEDARGNVTLFFYDGNDSVISISKEHGEQTRYAYDEEDRLIRVRDANSRRVLQENRYDDAGRLIAEFDGKVWLFNEYDASGRKIRVKDEQGLTLSEMVYNKWDKPVRVTDVRGKVTRFEYDELGQQVIRIDPNGSRTEFVYDEINRIDTVFDEVSDGSDFVREPTEREFSKIYGWDDVLWSIIDADDKETLFDYTDRNQLDFIVTPSGRATELFYDDRGYLQRYDPPTFERAQEYEYNAEGRLTRVTLPDGDADDVLYDYDEMGNVATISLQAPGSDPVVRIERTYDKQNRQISNTDAEEATIEHVYGNDGLLSKIIYPGGQEVSYTYDERGRLESIADWEGRLTEYTWGYDNQIERIQFPNGTTRVMTYGPTRLLLNRSDYDRNGIVIVSYNYGYDANGFITSQQVGGTIQYPFTTIEPVTLEYDDDNRLIKRNDENIGYDEDGNMVQGPIAGLSSTLIWDDRGNLRDVEDQFLFDYDVEDRLIGWVDGDETPTVLSVVEGPEGSRVMVSNNGAEETLYIYGVGLVYEAYGDEIRVHHYDEQGNSTALSSSSGVVSSRTSYGPFGETTFSEGDASSLFKYQGLFGVVTMPNGLSYMRHRWYSADLKRFISQDSVLGDITLPSSLNRYAYARNNPINFNDPQGEFWNVVVGAVTGAAFGAVTEIISSGLQSKPVNWNNVAAAAIGGAVRGALVSSGGVAFGVAGGAVGSITDDLISAGLNGTTINPERLALSAVASGVFRGGLAAKRTTFKVGLEQGATRGLSREAFRNALRVETGNFWKRGSRARGEIFQKLVINRLLVTSIAKAGLDLRFPRESPGEDSGAPPGNAGQMVEGVLEIPTANVGKGGERLHYQKYIEALIAADRPLPEPLESL